MILEEVRCELVNGDVGGIHGFSGQRARQPHKLRSVAFPHVTHMVGHR